MSSLHLFIPEPGDACEKLSLEEGRGVYQGVGVNQVGTEKKRAQHKDIFALLEVIICPTVVRKHQQQ